MTVSAGVGVRWPWMSAVCQRAVQYCIMMLLIADDVHRKWLWTRCGGGGVTSGSHDQYDRLCLRQVDVDPAPSSVFPARPSSTAGAATPDMM